MLDRFFLKPQTVDRIMGCWLGPEIELYVTVLCKQGYSIRSILRRVPILTEFAKFAEARNVNQIEQAEALIDAFVVDWVSARRTDRPARRGDATATSPAAPSGISSVWPYRSPSTTVPRVCGPIPLLRRSLGSSSIFAKSAAFVRVPFTTTSTTCAGSNAISIRWNAATSERWHCP